MNGFQKTKDCAPSEDILAFATSAKLSEGLRRHLSECEFCAAELELYQRHPIDDEKIHIGQMPEPLRELAEALLRGRPDVAQLYRLAER